MHHHHFLHHHHLQRRGDEGTAGLPSHDSTAPRNPPPSVFSRTQSSPTAMADLGETARRQRPAASSERFAPGQQHVDSLGGAPVQVGVPAPGPGPVQTTAPGGRESPVQVPVRIMDPERAKTAESLYRAQATPDAVPFSRGAAPAYQPAGMGMFGHPQRQGPRNAPADQFMVPHGGLLGYHQQPGRRFTNTSTAAAAHNSPVSQPPPPPPPPTFHLHYNKHHSQSAPVPPGSHHSPPTPVVDASALAASAPVPTAIPIVNNPNLGRAHGAYFSGPKHPNATGGHVMITVGGTQLDDLQLPQAPWVPPLGSPVDPLQAGYTRFDQQQQHQSTFHAIGSGQGRQEPVHATRYMKAARAQDRSLSTDPMLYEARVGGEVLGEPVQTLMSPFGPEQFGNIAQLTASIAPRVPSVTLRTHDVNGEASFNLRDFWHSLDAPFSSPVHLARPAHLSPHKPPESTLYYSPVLSSFSIAFHSESAYQAFLENDVDGGAGLHDEFSDKASSRSETGSQLSKGGGKRLRGSKAISVRMKARLLRKQLQALADEKKQAASADQPHLSAEMLSATAGSSEGATTGTALQTTVSSPLTPPGGLSLMWSSSERPENRPPLIDHVRLLAEDGFGALLDAKNTDLTYSSWVCVLWQPVFCHGHTPQQSCGSFLAYYLLRPPRHLFRSGGHVSHMNSSPDAPVFRCETNLIGIDLWRSQIAPPTTQLLPTPSAAASSTVPLSRRNLSSSPDGAAPPAGEFCTVPICAILPNRMRSDVWYEQISHSTVQKKVPLFLFLTALQVASAAAEPFQALASNEVSNADAVSTISASSTSGSPNYAVESTRNSHFLTDHAHTLRAERWLNDLGSLYLHA